MQILTIIATLIFIGYVLILRGGNLFSPKASQKLGNVAGEISIKESPSVSPMIVPTVAPSTLPKPTSLPSSPITIKVETQTGSTSTSQKLVYPGAKQVSGQENKYETSEAGETVYNWYKEEMEKEAYQIRTNVKAKANEKFKGVLQGVLNNAGIKVQIDQENSSSKTIIVLE